MSGLERLAVLLSLVLVACKGEKAAPAKPAGDQAPAEEREGERDEHGPHGDEVIALTPEAVKSAGIAMGRAEKKPFSATISVPARIGFTQRGVAKVSPRVPGRLDSIEVQLGQRVKRGQVLGYVESPDLGRSRAEFIAARTRADVAKANYEREKDLLAKKITSEREMREAEGAWAAARAELSAAEAHLHTLGLSDAEIFAFRPDQHPSSRFPARSPIDGTVVEISGTIGQSVEATAPLFTVGDLSKLLVLLDVAESQLAAIRPGQRVDVAVQALPKRRFDGRVEYVGDIVDERTRTIQVRVGVPNPDGALKPGMFATAEITARGEPGRDSPKVVVSADAVQRVGDADCVFVSAGENRFKAVRVRTGASSAREVEIVEGLEPGAEVVTQGSFILKSELSKESMGEGHSH